MTRLKKLRARAGIIRSAIRLTPTAPLGHYYSPATTPEDARRAKQWSRSTDMPVGVAMDLSEVDALGDQLSPMWGDLDMTRGRYRRAHMYEQVDAAIYHSMLRHFRPGRVLEVGSGYSTAVALDTIEAHDLDTVVECIEPNADRLRSLLRPDDDVHLHHSLVQDVSLDVFDQLRAGDFLFIDSTHVVKAGSDVVWTTLRVLPRLATGVIVHIHDIFWPLEYKDEWLDKRRDWTEIYLIHAFLSGNPSWRVLYFNDQAMSHRPDLAERWFPHLPGHRPGGLWLEKVG